MTVNNNSTFSQTVDLLHRAMSASSLRQAVIADNLANSEVPNFKRTDVTFESELGRALDSQRRRPALELNLTNPGHMSDWEPRDYKEVMPRRVLDFISQSNNNGNNVDPEEEFNLLLKNQLRYILLAQATAFEFGQANMALRSM